MKKNLANSAVLIDHLFESLRARGFSGIALHEAARGISMERDWYELEDAQGRVSYAYESETGGMIPLDEVVRDTTAAALAKGEKLAIDYEKLGPKEAAELAKRITAIDTGEAAADLVEKLERTAAPKPLALPDVPPPVPVTFETMTSFELAQLVEGTTPQKLEHPSAVTRAQAVMPGSFADLERDELASLVDATEPPKAAVRPPEGFR